MRNCAMGMRRMIFGTSLARESEAEVSVSDSGTGIPGDKLQGIFETFYTTKPQGTGLGLSIARTIVAAYGGRILGREQARRRSSVSLHGAPRAAGFDMNLRC